MNELKKLFHKHKWKRVKGTTHLYNSGMSKIATYKCAICGKKKEFDIFDVNEVKGEKR